MKVKELRNVIDSLDDECEVLLSDGCNSVVVENIQKQTIFNSDGRKRLDYVALINTDFLKVLKRVFNDDNS